MSIKYLSNHITVDLSKSRMIWDNGLLSDRRIELWVESLPTGETVWVETNTDPVTDQDEVVRLLVDNGMEQHVAEAAAEGDLSWIE